MSYKSCAICHNVKKPICNHCVLFDKFEKSEWAKDFESEIRADQRTKTIEEMAQTIRKIEADTTHCLFDCPRADEPITCTICTLEKAIKQLNGEVDNGKTIQP